MAEAAFTYYAPALRAGDEIIVRQHTLLANDESLKALIDAMPEMVMIVGQTRQIILANRLLAQFARDQGVHSCIGMRPGELLSCSNIATAPAGCGTGEACQSCGAVDSILAALEGKSSSQECRILRVNSYGIDAIDLKVWGSPFRWQGETLALVVAVDISNEKRRSVLERIFFHDILNTAGNMKSLAELLVSGSMTFDEVKDDLVEITNALVNEIRGQRELLAAENNELTVRPELLQSGQFLEGIATTYRSTPLGREREIVIEPLPQVRFYSDQRLLSRVLGNLVKNALEATPSGGTIHMGCSADGVRISFWCRNTGVMSRDTQFQIFHRSFSTKGPGRGIGTYSVKLLTERYLKGRVGFLSDEEEGTTFTVTYPIDLRK